jgi:hypothetical protein
MWRTGIGLDHIDTKNILIVVYMPFSSVLFHHSMYMSVDSTPPRIRDDDEDWMHVYGK